MPSKDMKCEFCDKTFRKNELGRHTKAKHVIELGQYILQEYITAKETTNPELNSLERYAKCINPKCNPIYSKLYEDGRYYFGANPTFFEKDDDAISYKTSDENMKIHNEFLSEVIKSISLYDYIQAERTIQINSSKVREIQNERDEVIKKYNLLQEEVQCLKNTITSQKAIINDYKETSPSTIAMMKEEIQNQKGTIDYYNKEINQLRMKLEKQTENIESRIQEVYEDARQGTRNLEDQNDKLRATNDKQKLQIELFSTKMESSINSRVEKETSRMKEQNEKEISRMKEQNEKEMKKLKEKLEKQHNKELEENEKANQKEMDELKKQIRKLKKNIKTAKSDDSDSD
jgi:chromosome segregation ATPase